MSDQPKWSRVARPEELQKLDSILTRFKEKLKPLKARLEEEVRKLNEEAEKRRTQAHNPQETDGEKE